MRNLSAQECYIVPVTALNVFSMQIYKFCHKFENVEKGWNQAKDFCSEILEQIKERVLIILA